MNEKLTGYDLILKYIQDESNKKTIKTDVFKLVFESKSFDAKYFMMTWMDNGLDNKDPNFKEYHAIYFQNLANNKYIEINSSKSPLEVYINDKKIY